MLECPYVYLMWTLYSRQSYEQTSEERISEIIDKVVGSEIWYKMEIREISNSTDRGCLHNYHLFIYICVCYLLVLTNAYIIVIYILY